MGRPFHWVSCVPLDAPLPARATHAAWTLHPRPSPICMPSAPFRASPSGAAITAASTTTARLWAFWRLITGQGRHCRTWSGSAFACDAMDGCRCGPRGSHGRGVWWGEVAVGGYNQRPIALPLRLCKSRHKPIEKRQQFIASYA